MAIYLKIIGKDDIYIRIFVKNVLYRKNINNEQYI